MVTANPCLNRMMRFILLIVVSLNCVMLSVIPAKSATENTGMTETYENAIDIPSIAAKWPQGHEMPKLIEDVGAVIKPWTWGSVGYFTMMGQRFDDYWIENGGDLSEQFGIFMKLPDGTFIGLWFHEGAVAGAEPVIEIGSEGALNIIAPNLKTFFLDWAEGRGILDLAIDESDMTANDISQRKILGELMKEVIAKAPDHPPSIAPPDLRAFMNQRQKAAIAAAANDPILQAITKVMDAQIPRGKEPWEVKHYHVRIAGSRVEIQPPFLPPDYTSTEPLPERDALIPLLLQAREARAYGKYAGRGLWHCASLTLSPDGTVNLQASWEFQPEFREGGPMTKKEFEADLARFPKDPKWIEPWMKELK
jgi:hypothetical protein